MQFNSLEYAIFLPIVFIVYWLINDKYRWLLLLLSSYVFYMCWNPIYVFLLMGITLVSYGAALLIDNVKLSKWKRLILSISIAVCVLLLVYFKYFGFLVHSFENVLNLFRVEKHFSLMEIILPVGISFYTFQAISYIIDVYRGTTKVEKHFGYYAVYISFFPQLVAGPIERSRTFLMQLKKEKIFDYNQATYGLKKMVWGFYKKLAIADVLAQYVNRVFGDITSYEGFSLILAMLFFTIQIYCDFSGYSDIAIGSAKLFGINLMDNFKSPYFSASIKEFWNRWHISLSTWLKDYIYIPLGGNRKGKLRQIGNLMITFCISGLWHGANYTYIIWGCIHGILNSIETIFDRNKNSNNKNKQLTVLRVVCVFIVCNFAWVFFRAENLSDAIYFFENMLRGIGSKDYIKLGFNSLELNKFYILQRFPLMILLPIYDFFSLKTDVIHWVSKQNLIIRWSIYFIMINIIIIMMSYASTSEFIYFQF